VLASTASGKVAPTAGALRAKLILAEVKPARGEDVNVNSIVPPEVIVTAKPVGGTSPDVW